ncbi:uncharacterized protein (DUF952 family) [Saccharomonospora amisosensis]|uniref:Uncharacterized protein (DUF952 family) n=1 Tax=Saccharomonospora amisosensis TaxID=1128677 RepID=A0A7X5UUT0_9PSEU|nr:DUF952 domain-containing protein [Saccharomonospora amisosensis]NIJ14520.1 uncharacterized protein (DUF952 family) [Saccharomonospora amisosensis]
MILHICSEADWAGVADSEHYRTRSLHEVGFIHCSDLGTVHLPATRLYRGRTDLFLLRIDPQLLDVPLRWEPGVPPEPQSPWFPHVYGPIPKAAVLSVHPFPPLRDGSFQPPSELAGLN